MRFGGDGNGSDVGYNYSAFFNDNDTYFTYFIYL